MRVTAATPDALGRDHPEWKPLLAVLGEAQRAFDNPLWNDAVPMEARASTGSGPSPAPLLDGAMLTVNVRATDRFVRRLFELAATGSVSAAAVRAAAHDERLDAVALMEAGICRTVKGLDDAAASVSVSPAVLRAIAAVAATLLLHACRRAWADDLPSGWTEGYCPVCGVVADAGRDARDREEPPAPLRPLRR